MASDAGKGEKGGETADGTVPGGAPGQGSQSAGGASHQRCCVRAGGSAGTYQWSNWNSESWGKSEGWESATQDRPSGTGPTLCPTVNRIICGDSLGITTIFQASCAGRRDGRR